MRLFGLNVNTGQTSAALVVDGNVIAATAPDSNKIIVLDELLHVAKDLIK
jgi:hypothetical protein